jgi:hypothetical protein
MTQPGTYALDIEEIQLNAYRLLCLFYANREIARLSDPDNRTDSATKLEATFFAREMTRLLLSIGIGLRVLDDQMNSLPADDRRRRHYLEALTAINEEYNCMTFDEMPLREVCNKIIHALSVVPHDQVVRGLHDLDRWNELAWSELPVGSLAPEPQPVEWTHLSGHIRLGGTYKGKAWAYLLEVPIFVDAIFELFQLIGIAHRASQLSM